MKTESMNLSLIKINPDNPRTIQDDKFLKLVKSIKSFPEMLRIRPIVINSDNVILGGNMRLKACEEAGLKEVPVIKAADLTEEQQKEFIIKDNSNFGEWNWELLSNEWDSEELEDWGLDIDQFDYSDKNQEIDTDSFSDEMIIQLKYSEADFHKVNTKLNEIAEEPGIAVLKLLDNG